MIEELAPQGLGRGVKDSGKGLYDFGKELIVHPISTANKMYESGGVAPIKQAS